MKLVDKVITTPVKEEDMAEFLPAVMQEFDSFSKEEVIKKFVSAEFNRFIEYYNRAGDINAKEGRGRDRDRDRGERGDRRERGGRRNDENKTSIVFKIRSNFCKQKFNIYVVRSCTRW